MSCDYVNRPARVRQAATAPLLAPLALVVGGASSATLAWLLVPGEQPISILALLGAAGGLLCLFSWLLASLPGRSLAKNLQESCQAVHGCHTSNHENLIGLMSDLHGTLKKTANLNRSHLDNVITQTNDAAEQLVMMLQTLDNAAGELVQGMNSSARR
jgi:hypothetical protein